MFGFNPDLNNKGKKDFYKYIKRENYEKYWDKLIKENPLLSKLSNEFKKLYFSMVAYNPEKRPKINDILTLVSFQLSLQQMHLSRLLLYLHTFHRAHFVSRTSHPAFHPD